MAAEAPSTPGPAAFGRRRARPVEQAVVLLLAAAAVVSVLVTVGIVFTLLEEGIPFFTDGDVSVWDFLTGTTWQPVNEAWGVLPLLAGMPTIVLGFFALDSIIPVLQDLGIVKETQLYSALGAGIVVGILITPLISSLSEDAMRAVPSAMREGAYAVGSTKRVVATRIVFPAALSGITAGIVLGLSRAIGETMAVTLAAGTQPNLTWDPTAPMQTITAYIVQVSQGEAPRGTIQYESIFAVGILLFLVTLLVNLIAVRFVRRFRTVYQ